MAVETTFDFDMMLSSAREAYGEELMAIADEGIDFAFVCSDNAPASCSAGKMMGGREREYFQRGNAPHCRRQ